MPFALQRAAKRSVTGVGELTCRICTVDLEFWDEDESLICTTISCSRDTQEIVVHMSLLALLHPSRGAGFAHLCRRRGWRR